MAAGQGADAYIELADFTGGIAATHASGGAAQMVREDPENPRVYAQRDYTAGCYGHPLGGLYPLPGIRDEVVEDDGDWADASVFPGSEQAMVVNATSILSPTVNPWFRVSDSYDGTLYRDTPDQLTVVYGSWGHPGGDDAYIGSGYSDEHYFIGLAEVRVFLMGGTMRDKTDLLGGHKVSDTQWLGDARIIEKSSVGTLDTTLAAKISRGLSPVSCFPLVTTAEGGAADAIGFPVTAVVSGNVGIYPGYVFSESDFNPNRVQIIDLQVNGLRHHAWWGIMHQNQLVFSSSARRTGSSWGVYGDPISIIGFSGGHLADDDHIGWFPANQVGETPTIAKFRFMPEAPVGYGAMAVVNANELFMVKHNGGALVVRGDVANPQIINLAGVPSTRGAANVPVTTPLGVIYGTRDGVWMWTGGEDAESLSPLLDGCFWLPDDHPDLSYGHPAAPRGKFNYSHPFVYAPNNWILDLRTRAWFRLHPTASSEVTGVTKATYRNYEVSATGRVYAVKSIVTPDDLTVAHLYDPETPCRSFHFRSHPIRRTINRQLKFREVVVEAQGRGTVTVNLYGDGSEPGGPASATFTIGSADRPVTLRKEVSAEFANVEVEIISTSVEDGLPSPSTTTDGVTEGSAEYPAPIVHRVSLGYRGDRSVQRGD